MRGPCGRLWQHQLQILQVALRNCVTIVIYTYITMVMQATGQMHDL
jgi:hypothetical protein